MNWFSSIRILPSRFVRGRKGKKKENYLLTGGQSDSGPNHHIAQNLHMYIHTCMEFYRRQRQRPHDDSPHKRDLYFKRKKCQPSQREREK